MELRGGGKRQAVLAEANPNLVRFVQGSSGSLPSRLGPTPAPGSPSGTGWPVQSLGQAGAPSPESEGGRGHGFSQATALRKAGQGRDLGASLLGMAGGRGAPVAPARFPGHLRADGLLLPGQRRISGGTSGSPALCPLVRAVLRRLGRLLGGPHRPCPRAALAPTGARPYRRPLCGAPALRARGRGHGGGGRRASPGCAPAPSSTAQESDPWPACRA